MLDAASAPVGGRDLPAPGRHAAGHRAGRRPDPGPAAGGARGPPGRPLPAAAPGGARALDPRQQTLRATVDWSYDLLDRARNGALLRRLSVFSGGWTVAAAEAVCGGDGLEAAEVLDGLFRLVDRSLVG